MAYADPSDISAHALPSGALSNPGRTVFADASLDLFTLDVHGLSTDDPVEFRAEGSTGVLPAPLASGTTYYAIVLSESRFQVASAPAGAAIDLTTGGNNVIARFPVPVQAALDWATEIIDDMLPAHVVPFAAESVPAIVRMTCAELAGGKLLSRGGTSSAELSKIVDAASKRLERWATKHVPIRNAGQPASLATSVAASSTDGGWRNHGGL